MIYFAPLQGFTDFVYRKAYAQIFHEVDAYFIPYILVKSGIILPKYKREISPQNNPETRVVPQVLIKDSKELIELTQFLQQCGYTELNLNLGCPYSMVTNRGRGSGLLPFPDKIRNLLENYFDKFELDLSIKLRAGLNSADEFEQLIPVLNDFPIKEVIFHPRTAQQMYKGEIREETFLKATNKVECKLIFNGDIFSVSDFLQRKNQFPTITNWMLGRGILLNPFLPSEIKGIDISKSQRKDRLMELHHRVFESYWKIMDNDGNTLNKMKQFWMYFCANFNQPQKAFKRIKKANNISKYKAVVAGLFAELN